jgi:hypothetical protein
MRERDYNAPGNVFDMEGRPVENLRGLHAAEAQPEAQPRQDFVYDPITGMPLADPSGSLQAQGFEKMPADAALAIGNNVAAGVGNLFGGLKLLLYGALGLGALFIVAEAAKLGRDAFGPRYKRNPSRRRRRRKNAR